MGTMSWKVLSIGVSVLVHRQSGEPICAKTSLKNLGDAEALVSLWVGKSDVLAPWTKKADGFSYANFS